MRKTTNFNFFSLSHSS